MQVKFEHVGSLITYQDPEDQKDRALGFLMHFEGHGVYDAALGKVDISPEDANTHNRELEKAMLTGLDESCEVGQGGTFYTDGKTVKTFLGTLVSDQITKVGQSLTFRRGGKVFRGRMSKEHDSFNFRRIA